MRSGNFDAALASAAAHTTANTEFTVAHGLGSGGRPAIPRGYFVIRRSAAASLYISGTAWTSTTAYFKSDVGSARFTVLFFA